MKKIIIFGLSLGFIGGLAGCGSEPTDSANSNTAQTTSQSSQSQASSEGNAQSFKVSVEEAIKAYQEAYPNSDVTSLDLESSLGKYVYKIEGVDDEKEYEMTVNADTKDMSKEREEMLDAEDKNGAKRKEDKLELNKLLSVEKVSALAVEHVGKGEATEWGLDKDLGTTYWEVKVKDGQKETEVKVDAQSGKILESETDDE
ncbi:MAG: PepSY domain-containing protein [Enterococcus viikkiensis]|uniref:PepSY domain-containing protein n=1 Tax=Enterococcus viikkiensis TaxID=930854 RepID=A0ABU3FP96_9ENTE|nr:PepSY domain-containing protein [Enterococcus viikkiensis]MDT2827792.1 PepSY domain-containing protein [Enterococcus viikkiensis]